LLLHEHLLTHSFVLRSDGLADHGNVSNPQERPMTRTLAFIVITGLASASALAFNPQPDPPKTQTSIKTSDGSVKSVGSMKTETIGIQR
jgi:hypothetical protein